MARNGLWILVLGYALAVYYMAYRCCVDRWVMMSPLSRVWSPQVLVSEYYPCDWMEPLFRPAHAVDRLMRPDFWNGEELRKAIDGAR